MKSQAKKTIAILLTVCFVLSITAATVSAAAGNPNPGVVPVNSNSLGRLMGNGAKNGGNGQFQYLQTEILY